MSTHQQLAGNPLRQKTWVQRFADHMKKYWILHAMMFLPMLYYFLFHMLPLYGLQIVFRDYKTKAGLLNSEWVGLANFQKFFAYYKWKTITWNTLIISLYQIGVGFPIPIFLALVIHVNENKILKKLAQNVSYVPHFISVVVMVGLLRQILNPFSGLLGVFLQMMGSNNRPDIWSSVGAFRHLYVWSGVWQNMGWSTIMYVAALAGVSQELHEAAKIDGASRWRRVLSVDLPAIAPTIAIMLILRFGSIMSVGHEKAYLMQTSLNLDKSEFISTYVYKRGISKNQMSYGAAVGVMNSVINSAMVILVNKIAGWVSDGEAGLF